MALKKMRDLQIRDHLLNLLFPRNYSNNKLAFFLGRVLKVISSKVKNRDRARVPGSYDVIAGNRLEKRYGELTDNNRDPVRIIEQIIRDFSSGTPLWRSTNLQYNVGSATNIASVALYAIAQDINIYNINDGLAGTALAAERAVARILSSLAKVDHKKSFGLFTFGGTATNLYALKVATRKIDSQSGLEGVPKKVCFFMTEDAHFSHAVATDWLGVGTKNIVVMGANKDRTTNIRDAEEKMRRALSEGKVLAAIMLNGGTTYDHAIDDIHAFVQLRDRLVEEFSLAYVPHLHVDSVIGWAWLMFQDYDFRTNTLGVGQKTLEKIKMQYERIRHIRLADSWGVDFHKGVGGCPIPCSVIMMNNRKDFQRLDKSSDPLTATHQLAKEFSFESPSEYTLETSRPGGAPLAALGALHTLGRDGYRLWLANLVSSSLLTKKLIDETCEDIKVCNPNSLGYVTMVRIYPPHLKLDSRKENELYDTSTGVAEFNKRVNKYMKEFFTWDFETRMKKGIGTEYSFSSTYLKTPHGIKMPAIKFYPTSPHITPRHARKAVAMLKQRKIFFDQKNRK